jgi:hypothetical protein
MKNTDCRMNIFFKAISGALLIVLFFFGPEVFGQARDERTVLVNQAKAERKKAAALKREQDFLVFQKEMYAADSKYLVLNMKDGSGQLRYKNRVLKEFQFAAAGKLRKNTVPFGMLSVTKKMTGKDNRYALIFGVGLIIRLAESERLREEAAIPALMITKDDMLSLLSALEEGGRAYILP